MAIREKSTEICNTWYDVWCCCMLYYIHYNDVTMSIMASQITCNSMVYSTISLSWHQRKHQRMCYRPFGREIHWRLMDFPHKGLVLRTAFPLCHVIMTVIGIFSHNKLQGLGCSTTIHHKYTVAFVYKSILWLDVQAPLSNVRQLYQHLISTTN